MGVKKSGTMTLDNFLNYHPNMQVVGERYFPDSQRENVKEYINSMPLAKPDQLVIAKSRGVWQHKDVMQELQNHRNLVPDAKLLMIVRDPITRYVSDFVHYNRGHHTYERPRYDSLDDIIQGKVKTVIYYGESKFILEHLCTLQSQNNPSQINQDYMISPFINPYWILVTMH